MLCAFSTSFVFIIVATVFQANFQGSNGQLTTAETNPQGSHSPRRCGCTPGKIWLDIIVVFEVSDSMTAAGLNQAKAAIAPLIGTLPVDQSGQMTSRVSIVYFSQRAVTQANLKTYASTTAAVAGINAVPYVGDHGVNLEGALQEAATVISTSKARPNVKSMIIFVTSSNQNGQFLDPKPVADQLKSEGVTIVTIAFAQTDESKPPEILWSSPGFNFTNRDPRFNQLMLGAFCDTNCYCPSNWYQFGDSQVKKYGECVYPGDFPTTWTAAKLACTSTRSYGFLADELSANKHSFLKNLATTMFASADPFAFWIGLTYQNGQETWDRGNPSSSNSISSNDYQNWAPGNPNLGAGSCTAELYYLTSSITKWQSKECSSPFTATFNYFCQIPACDTDTWCFQ